MIGKFLFKKRVQKAINSNSNFVDVNNIKQDLLFDSEGSDGLLSKMIAGGYFYVKSSEKTQKFFSNIASTLLDYYVTDNNLMARQCLLKMFDNECASISYK